MRREPISYAEATIRALEEDNAELLADNERLRAALERIAKFDVPREVGHTFRSDGVPSKHDKCLHGETMYDECAPCMAVFANAAFAQPAAPGGDK